MSGFALPEDIILLEAGTLIVRVKVTRFKFSHGWLSKFADCRAENGNEEPADKEVVGKELPAHKDDDVDAPDQEPLKADDEVIAQAPVIEEQTDPSVEDTKKTEVPSDAPVTMEE